MIEVGRFDCVLLRGLIWACCCFLGAKGRVFRIKLAQWIKLSRLMGFSGFAYQYLRNRRCQHSGPTVQSLVPFWGPSEQRRLSPSLYWVDIVEIIEFPEHESPLRSNR